MTSFIYLNNKRYNYYETYMTWEQAYKTARYYQKKNKLQYYILKVRQGFAFPMIKYRLYLTKTMRLF